MLFGVGLLIGAPNATAKPRSTVDRFVTQFVDSCWPQVVAPLKSRHRLMVVTRFRHNATMGSNEGLSESILARLEGELRKRMGAVQLEFMNNVPWSNVDELLEGARNADITRLLVVELFIERNHLHAVGNHYEVGITLWSRIRNPPGGVRGHYYFSTRIDAELRALMDRPPIRQSQPSFREEPLPIADLKTILSGAAGDLDADGFQELVLLHQSKLTVHRWLPNHAPEPVTTYDFSKLTRRSRRSRDHFGAIVTGDVNGDGTEEIAFWTSDLKHGHVLTLHNGQLKPLRLSKRRFSCGHGSTLETRALLCGPPLMVEPRDDDPNRVQIVQGDVSWGRNHLNARVSIWHLGGGGAYHPWKGLHWNLFGGLHRFAEGSTAMLRTSIDKEGNLTVRGGTQSWSLPAHAGIAGALTDFDDDGEPELIRTRKSGPNGPDALIIHRLAADRSSALEIWRKDKPSSAIESIMAGDIDNDGYNDVLIVRGGVPYRLTENHRRR
jgi:hypothetical protein